MIMEEIKYDVFISYSRKDYCDEQNNVIPNNEVSKIMQALTDAGISYWIDLEGIYSGDAFVTKITENIKASRILLFLSTQNSNNSIWTTREVTYANELEKSIIPIRVDETTYSDDMMLILLSFDPIPYHESPELKLNDMITIIKEQLKVIKKKEEDARILKEKEMEERISKLQSSIDQLKSEIDKLKADKSSYSKQVEQNELKTKKNIENLSQLKNEQNEFKVLQTRSLKPDKREEIKYDVYISYSPKDYIDEQNNEIPNNEVSRIMQALSDADISFERIKGNNNNDSFSKKVIQSIRASRILLFLSTYNSNFNSSKTINEIKVAIELKKCILPLRVDNSAFSDEVMFSLQNVSHLNYHVNPEQGRIAMINTIKNQLNILKNNEITQQEEEENRRQNTYNKYQQKIDHNQSIIDKINDENNHLKNEKSQLEETIKSIDNEIYKNTKKHTELTDQLNKLINPTPPPIPIEPINKYLKRWNWGAFILNCIWGLGNKLYVLSIAAIITILILFLTIQPLGAVLLIGFAIFLGFKGNELAWNKRKPEMTFDDFKSIQQKWCIAGIILLACIVLIAALSSNN